MPSVDGLSIHQDNVLPSFRTKGHTAVRSAGRDQDSSFIYITVLQLAGYSCYGLFICSLAGSLGSVVNFSLIVKFALQCISIGIIYFEWSIPFEKQALVPHLSHQL